MDLSFLYLPAILTVAAAIVAAMTAVTVTILIPAVTRQGESVDVIPTITAVIVVVVTRGAIPMTTADIAVAPSRVLSE